MAAFRCYLKDGNIRSRYLGARRDLEYLRQARPERKLLFLKCGERVSRMIENNWLERGVVLESMSKVMLNS